MLINIGGVSAHIGVHDRARVAAAKAGVVGPTKSLAMEFADPKAWMPVSSTGMTTSVPLW